MLYGDIYRYIFNKDFNNEVIIDTDRKEIISDLNLNNQIIQTKRLKEYAKEILTTQLQELSRKHKKSFNKLIIRDQKTKRGTCSSQKNI